MLALGKKFNEAGFSLYLVGGAVRDYLLGKENDDADFTTDATPDEVINLFPKSTIPTGIKHGTVTVVINNNHYTIYINFVCYEKTITIIYSAGNYGIYRQRTAN